MNVLTSLKALWRGQLPLREAFWRYAITYDLVLNLAATMVALTLILREAPIIFAIVIHFVPLPYSLLAATGTWRSADRYDGNPSVANAVKVVIIIWVGFWVFL